jgi:hypothetical protein
MGQLQTAVDIGVALARWKRYRDVSSVIAQQRDLYNQGLALGHSDPDPAVGAASLRAAMGGPDPEIALEAAREAISLFSRSGDHPTARQYVGFMEQIAQAHGYSARLGPEIQQLAQREDRAFDHAEWYPPVQTPTLRKAPGRDQHPGLTHDQLMSAMGQMHTRDRAAFDQLNHSQDVRASVTGRLVQDRQGRLGVLDLTTGRTALLDVRRDATGPDGRPVADDVGKIVRCEGTTDLWSTGARLKVSGFGAVPAAQARAGFRIEDPKVERLTAAARQQQHTL